MKGSDDSKDQTNKTKGQNYNVDQIAINEDQLYVEAIDKSVHDGKKPYECSKCDSRFLQEKELNTHITSAHVVEIHSVPNESNLPKIPVPAPRRRENNHYKCKYCENIFPLVSSLQQHVEFVHDGNKCFECDI